MANNISSITRRDILTLLTQGWDENELFGGTKHIYYNIWGVFTPPEFLNRIYPMESLPSYDSRVSSAAADIHLHTVVNP